MIKWLLGLAEKEPSNPTSPNSITPNPDKDERLDWGELGDGAEEYMKQCTGHTWRFLDATKMVMRHCLYTGIKHNEVVSKVWLFLFKKPDNMCYATIEIEKHYGRPQWDGSEMHYNYPIKKKKIVMESLMKADVVNAWAEAEKFIFAEETIK